MSLRRLAVLALAAAGALALASPAAAQEPAGVSGMVVDLDTGKGIPDVVLRVKGTDASAVTNAEGAFVLTGLPAGAWTLLVEHLAYGSHEHPISLEAGRSTELQIRLAVEAIELDALVVDVPGVRTRGGRAEGTTTLVVDREQIERTISTSRHLGDFLRQAVPGIRIRQSNALEDTDVCVEFRASGTSSLQRLQGCNHPMVFLDGVPIGNPQALYGSLGLQNIERIQVIPPGAAGARYGSGSLFGVLLIETRPPGSDRGVPSRPGMTVTPVDLQKRSAFDWSRDPEGHNLLRASAGAFLGNAVGLAAGVAIGRRCIGISQEHEIETRCSFAGDATAGLAAMVLPAAAASLGARWGGATAASRGRLLPSVLGAGLMLFPGYAFSMATVGGGSGAANAAGAVMLVVGTPLLVTLADRMFRDLR